MYPTAVISLFWMRDSFCGERRVWLPCHISKQSWDLAVLWKFLSSATFFNSESLSVSVVSNTKSSPANDPWLAWANCLITSISPRVSQVNFDCLQPITSRAREALASTPTPCCMIEIISPATFDRSVYFEWVSPCCCDQSVISSNQIVLLISVGPEWESLRFGLTCPQFFGDSGGKFKLSLAVVNQGAA